MIFHRFGRGDIQRLKLFANEVSIKSESIGKGRVFLNKPFIPRVLKKFSNEINLLWIYQPLNHAEVYVLQRGRMHQIYRTSCHAKSHTENARRRDAPVRCRPVSPRPHTGKIHNDFVRCIELPGRLGKAFLWPKF